MFEKNTLYYGDNLEVLRKFPDNCIDLIYLDPPFNSGANYNVLFKEENGKQPDSQIVAFTDTWHWDKEGENSAEQTYVKLQLGDEKISTMVKSMRAMLGQTPMASYVMMMTVRLIELKRVLKPTGSIYLHCDPTASHYIKIVMDTVFGVENFRNEIVWCYTGRSASKKDFPRKHDIIFWYSKSLDFYSNLDLVRIPYKELHSDKGKDAKLWGNGGQLQNEEIRNEYISKGKIPEDYWIDIPSGGHISPKERLGYPTQKPLTLLERIIKASCPPDGIVLDPFCGCGTTIEASQKLGRKWIGIDITHLAVALIKSRLKDKLNCLPKRDYEIKGQPADFESVKALAEQDKYQFQYWAGYQLHDKFQPIGQSASNPYGKKGADQGIDGWLKFEESDHTVQKIAIQVKSGGVGASTIRDLIGTVNNTGSSMGILITLEEPTTPMKQASIEAGYFKTKSVGMDIQYPKIQIATIKELMDGIKPKFPPIKR